MRTHQSGHESATVNDKAGEARDTNQLVSRNGGFKGSRESGAGKAPENPVRQEGREAADAIRPRDGPSGPAGTTYSRLARLERT
jgi:hypothetical protein